MQESSKNLVFKRKTTFLFKMWDSPAKCGILDRSTTENYYPGCRKKSLLQHYPALEKI